MFFTGIAILVTMMKRNQNLKKKKKKKKTKKKRKRKEKKKSEQQQFFEEEEDYHGTGSISHKLQILIANFNCYYHKNCIEHFKCIF